MSTVMGIFLVPLLCWLLTLMLPLSDGFRIGLMLLAAGAGSPFVPLLVSLSKGNKAWTAALMVLFTVVTVVYMPLMLPLMLPGVKVDPLGIAKSLVVVMLLPLVAGLFVHAWREPLALRLVPIFAKISTITLILMLVLLAILGHDATGGCNWAFRHSGGRGHGSGGNGNRLRAGRARRGQPACFGLRDRIAQCFRGHGHRGAELQRQTRCGIDSRPCTPLNGGSPDPAGQMARTFITDGPVYARKVKGCKLGAAKNQVSRSSVADCGNCMGSTEIHIRSSCAYNRID